MSESVDVTAQVDFQFNDDESLPLTKCVCGVKVSAWTYEYVIGIERDHPTVMPCCGRKLYWTSSIRVREALTP